MLFRPGSPEDRVYRDYALWLGHTSEVSAPARVGLRELAKSFDGFFLDSYGVLNQAGEALPTAAAGVAWLKAQGKTVRVLTNNAALSEEENRLALCRLGIPLDEGEVICYGSLLAEAGLDITEDAAQARCVVLASTRGYRMRRIAIARAILSRGDVPLIVLNPDTVAPREGGHMFRVSGVTARSLQDDTGCKVLLLGKPFGAMYDMALRRTGLSRERSIVMGDTLATDILGGRRAGFAAALVLTGVTPESGAMVMAQDQRIWPDYLVPDLSID